MTAFGAVPPRLVHSRFATGHDDRKDPKPDPVSSSPVADHITQEHRRNRDQHKLRQMATNSANVSPVEVHYPCNEERERVRVFRPSMLRRA